MEKYIIAPPAGSQTNALGAKDRPWEEVHANRYPGINEYLAESTGYGIVSGCEPSISGLTVKVGAGVIHLADGTRKEIAQTNITLDNADPTNPRIDLVYINADGEVAKVTGTAAASPSVPAVPTGGISVCNVNVAAGATTGTITAKRDVLPRFYNTGIVNVKDFGAVGDGVTDDTQSIQAAIDSGGNIFIPSGTYLVSKTLVKSGSISIFSDNATLLITDNSNFDSINVMGSLQVGVIVQTTNPAYININGITIRNNSNGNCVGIYEVGDCDKCCIVNSKGINLQGGLFLCRSSVFETVDSNTEGTCIPSMKRFIGMNCYAENGGYGQNPALFHVRSNNVEISNNVVKNAKGYAIRVDGGSFNTIPSVNGVHNININHNQIFGWGTGQIAIQVTKSFNVNVSNNQFIGSDETGYQSNDNSVDIFNCHNVLISNNQIKNAGGLFAGHADLNHGTATNLIGTRNVKITDNEIYDAKNQAIFVGGDGVVDGDKATDTVEISNNLIKYSALSNVGIYTFITRNVFVHDNIFDSSSYAIKTYYDKRYNVVNNIFSNTKTLYTEGSDWMTTPTHIIGNNTYLNTNGTATDLNSAGEILYTQNASNRTIILQKNRDCKYAHIKGLNGSKSRDFTVYIPHGSAVIDITNLLNKEVGGGNGGTNYSEDVIVIRAANTNGVSIVNKVKAAPSTVYQGDGITVTASYDSYDANLGYKFIIVVNISSAENLQWSVLDTRMTLKTIYGS